MPTYRDDAARVSLLERCRELRRSATNAEALLWLLLRARQIAGAKFRRQHQFGRFILDFYCHEAKLAIELDGAHHSSRPARAADAARSAYLESRGIRVVRFANDEVLDRTEGVITRIWNAVTLTPALSQWEREPETNPAVTAADRSTLSHTKERLE
jgi:very-short-patch-repair endonuclease